MNIPISCINSEKLDSISHKIITNRVNSCSKKELFFIDATAGNGYDTLFLAQLIEKKGLVVAFDIQEQAIKNTQHRLINASLENYVLCVPSSHHSMYTTYSKLLKKHGYNQLSTAIKCTAIMFNLGYLPGSNKQIITRPQTTLQALDDALRLLKTDGVLSIHCYTGHPGGLEEKTAIFNWVQKLRQNKWYIKAYTKNYKHSEQLLLIQRIWQ